VGTIWSADEAGFGAVFGVLQDFDIISGAYSGPFEGDMFREDDRVEPENVIPPVDFFTINIYSIGLFCGDQRAPYRGFRNRLKRGRDYVGESLRPVSKMGRREGVEVSRERKSSRSSSKLFLNRLGVIMDAIKKGKNVPGTRRFKEMLHSPTIR
jgi:hypothetical protein